MDKRFLSILESSKHPVQRQIKETDTFVSYIKSVYGKLPEQLLGDSETTDLYVEVMTEQNVITKVPAHQEVLKYKFPEYFVPMMNGKGPNVKSYTKSKARGAIPVWHRNDWNLPMVNLFLELLYLDAAKVPWSRLSGLWHAAVDVDYKPIVHCIDDLLSWQHLLPWTVQRVRHVALECGKTELVGRCDSYVQVMEASKIRDDEEMSIFVYHQKVTKGLAGAPGDSNTSSYQSRLGVDFIDGVLRTVSTQSKCFLDLLSQRPTTDHGSGSRLHHGPDVSGFSSASHGGGGGLFSPVLDLLLPPQQQPQPPAGPAGGLIKPGPMNAAALRSVLATPQVHTPGITFPTTPSGAGAVGSAMSSNPYSISAPPPIGSNCVAAAPINGSGSLWSFNSGPCEYDGAGLGSHLGRNGNGNGGSMGMGGMAKHDYGLVLGQSPGYSHRLETFLDRDAQPVHLTLSRPEGSYDHYFNFLRQNGFEKESGGGFGRGMFPPHAVDDATSTAAKVIPRAQSPPPSASSASHSFTWPIGFGVSSGSSFPSSASTPSSGGGSLCSLSLATTPSTFSTSTLKSVIFPFLTTPVVSAAENMFSLALAVSPSPPPPSVAAAAAGKAADLAVMATRARRSSYVFGGPPVPDPAWLAADGSGRGSGNHNHGSTSLLRLPYSSGVPPGRNSRQSVESVGSVGDSSPGNAGAEGGSASWTGPAPRTGSPIGLLPPGLRRRRSTLVVTSPVDLMMMTIQKGVTPRPPPPVSPGEGLGDFRLSLSPSTSASQLEILGMDAVADFGASPQLSSFSSGSVAAGMRAAYGIPSTPSQYHLFSGATPADSPVGPRLSAAAASAAAFSVGDYLITVPRRHLFKALATLAVGELRHVSLTHFFSQNTPGLFPMAADQAQQQHYSALTGQHPLGGGDKVDADTDFTLQGGGSAPDRRRGAGGGGRSISPSPGDLPHSAVAGDSSGYQMVSPIGWSMSSSLAVGLPPPLPVHCNADYFTLCINPVCDRPDRLVSAVLNALSLMTDQVPFAVISDVTRKVHRVIDEKDDVAAKGSASRLGNAAGSSFPGQAGTSGRGVITPGNPAAFYIPGPNIPGAAICVTLTAGVASTDAATPHLAPHCGSHLVPAGGAQGRQQFSAAGFDLGSVIVASAALQQSHLLLSQLIGVVQSVVQAMKVSWDREGSAHPLQFRSALQIMSPSRRTIQLLVQTNCFYGVEVLPSKAPDDTSTAAAVARSGPAGAKPVPDPTTTNGFATTPSGSDGALLFIRKPLSDIMRVVQALQSTLPPAVDGIRGRGPRAGRRCSQVLANVSFSGPSPSPLAPPMNQNQDSPFVSYPHPQGQGSPPSRMGRGSSRMATGQSASDLCVTSFADLTLGGNDLVLGQKGRPPLGFPGGGGGAVTPDASTSPTHYDSNGLMGGPGGSSDGLPAPGGGGRRSSWSSSPSPLLGSLVNSNGRQLNNLGGVPLVPESGYYSGSSFSGPPPPSDGSRHLMSFEARSAGSSTGSVFGTAPGNGAAGNSALGGLQLNNNNLTRRSSEVRLVGGRSSPMSPSPFGPRLAAGAAAGAGAGGSVPLDGSPHPLDSSVLDLPRLFPGWHLHVVGLAKGHAVEEF